MKETKRIMDYSELGYSNDFMFGKVMQDKALCRDVLECLLQHPVGELEDIQPQKEFRYTKDGKPIRLDIYTRDEHMVYDAEVQNKGNKKVEDLELCGRPFMRNFPFAEVEREYNGIGPEFFDPELRAKVTRFLAVFEPAAVVHDMRNYMSDGTRDAFHYANWEFLENCRKCADDAYPWWSWKRYRARAVAKILYDFVNGSNGWRAWMDCYERTQNKKKQGAKKQ